MIAVLEITLYRKDLLILPKFEHQNNYNCSITTDARRTYNVYANWIHNNRLDQWKGWNCSVGTTRLYIDKNLEVYSGECQNDHLGSALSENFEILNGAVCKQETCTGCTDDLVVAKQDPNYEIK